MIKLIDHIISSGNLTLEQFAGLMVSENKEGIQYLFSVARDTTAANFGRKASMHALLHLSSHCSFDCSYCPSRHSQPDIQRCRLSAEQILQHCTQAQAIGFRHILLSAGPDAALSDDFLIPLLSSIRQQCPQLSVSLALGVRSRQSYERLRQAGVVGYLLRHKTADPIHFAKLHPHDIPFEHYQQAYEHLAQLQFQVGSGFIVGTPHQTLEILYQELQRILTLCPHLVSVSPLLPLPGTPLADRPGATLDATLRLLALIRILHPQVLLPTSAALLRLHPSGHELGLLAGANIILQPLQQNTIN